MAECTTGAEFGAAAIASAVAAHATTAEAATRACLDRIAARERAVEAWAYLDPEQAIAEARLRDRSGGGGPLAGVPVGIKDIMDTGDMPTSYGSSIYAGHRPRVDAACVAALRAAGAVILGKTVTTEFAAVHPGKTHNPHNPAHTPGGSSSGSAAAVADGMAAAALGTQTMGSVIRPAAYCGVVGFKPSFGLINRAGIKPQAESIDTIGVMARSVDDAALVAAVLCGAPPASFAAGAKRPPRIALYRGPDWQGVTPAVDRNLTDVAQRLAAAGATVEDAGAPAILREALDAHFTIVVAELGRAFAPEWLRHREALSPALAAMIGRGLDVSFDTYLAALDTAAAARLWIAERFAHHDIWLSASAPSEAPEGLANTGDPVLNRLWSLLHLPVVTVPSGRGPAGLPLGVSLVGPGRRDADLLAAARWVEAQLAA